MPASSVETLEGRAAASGEVGLLGEEAAQRLLSIFVESAMSCLGQIRVMSIQHGDGKFDALFQVGLDLVQRWDSDVVQEEVTRVETVYPEIPALHSYAFLWLLDRLCGDRDIKSLSVPPLSDVYAGFMKRVAVHRDVRQARTFLAAPELHRRTVFVEAFRGSYHDVLQQRAPPQRGGAARYHNPPLTRGMTPSVSPDEAASQVGAMGASARVLEVTSSARTEVASSANAESRTVPPSALQKAMHHHGTGRAPPPPLCGGGGRYVAVKCSREDLPAPPPPGPDATFSLPEMGALVGATTAPPRSDVAPSSSLSSNRTKAVTVTGPCFFSHDAPASALRFSSSLVEAL